MTKEMREIMDSLQALEERSNALNPLAETAEEAEIEERAKELEAIEAEKKELLERKEAIEAEERAAAQVNEHPEIATEIEQKGPSPESELNGILIFPFSGRNAVASERFRSTFKNLTPLAIASLTR